MYIAPSPGKAHSSLAHADFASVSRFEFTHIETRCRAELPFWPCPTLGILPNIRRAAPLMRADTPIRPQPNASSQPIEMTEPILRPSSWKFTPVSTNEALLRPLRNRPLDRGRAGARRPRRRRASAREDHRVVRDPGTDWPCRLLLIGCRANLRGLEICLAYKNPTHRPAWADGMTNLRR